MRDVLLVCYHAVSEDWPAALSVTPEHLERHVATLKRLGYRGVTVSEAITGPAADRAVAITFDDAYRSVFMLGRSILQDAGFPATVFAPTAFIGQDAPMSWPGVEHWLDGPHRAELVPMSWSELAELATAGWEVGSHTRTHRRLPELDPSALDAELALSRAEIEDRMDAPCRSLAYPYGAHDQRVVEATRRAGYQFGVGTLPGRLRPPTGPLDWPRIVINHPDSARRFRMKTSRFVRGAKASRAWDGVAAARRGVRKLRNRGRSDG